MAASAPARRGDGRAAQSGGGVSGIVVLSRLGEVLTGACSAQPGPVPTPEGWRGLNMISTVQQLVTDPGFLIGLGATLALLLMAWLSKRQVSLLSIPVVGTLAAMAGTGQLDPALAGGVAITLVPAHWVARPMVRHLLTAVALLITLVAADTADEPALIALVIAAAIAIQRPTTLHDRPRSVVVLVALTVLGVWGTVPDTDLLRILVGATAGISLAILIESKALVIDMSGAMRLGVLVGALILAGGDNRAGSIVGGAGSFGMLLVGDSVELGPYRFEVRSQLHLVAAHLALVIVWSRIAGLRTSTLSSLALGLPLTVLVVWAGMKRTDVEQLAAETPEDA